MIAANCSLLILRRGGMSERSAGGGVKHLGVAKDFAAAAAVRDGRVNTVQLRIWIINKAT